MARGVGFFCGRRSGWVQQFHFPVVKCADRRTGSVGGHGVVHHTGGTVIIQGPIPRTGGLNDAQRATLPGIDQRAATLAGNCFVTLLTALGTADGKLLSQYDVGDGVHTNDAGHAVIFNGTDTLLKNGKCIAKPK